MDARAGDEGFDALFCGLLPRLYRRAVLLAGEGCAEDAVHEAYLKLARRPDRLLGHPEPYAYAFRALVSVTRDMWRARSRQVLLPEPPEPGARAASSADDPIARREAEWEAVRMLGSLPAKQAAAVLLVDLDGYTIDQAAEILGVHRGTVSRSRERALARLRTGMGGPTGRFRRRGRHEGATR
ncbi:RNA polymerase sigma factor [Embleya sp. NBC_00896]|uniref:RNA polymerase sigma factor n=1 Tax=Embleya sp. NBC_00896 TaxID=2975961 RepID=UPI00386F43EC|nr:RNA polymerase sigma factor [Embleya sp. NBC_00896]